MNQHCFKITPMDREASRAIIEWRYPPPYDLYNIVTEDTEVVISAFLDPDFGYYKITNEEAKLVAFCNFGLDARVPGGDYSVEALDIGMGVHPDLTGKGSGQIYAQYVLDYAEKIYHPDIYRVTIAAFNERAQKVWVRTGFSLTQRFKRSLDGKDFMIFTRWRAEID